MSDAQTYMSTNPELSIDELWNRTRSGARAGHGFRFQDAAATTAAVLCWAGKINGNAVVPESLDDFSIESEDAITYVQTKSKVSNESGFSISEIAKVLSVDARPVEAAKSSTRVILIDRTFNGHSYECWDRCIADEPMLVGQFNSTIGAFRLPERILSRSALITWPMPINVAANEIAFRRKILLAVALLCAHRLMAIMGERTDTNAAVPYGGRAKLTVGEVDREIDATLNLTDSGAVEAAIKKGLVEYLDFGTSLVEPGYYLGVSTLAGHVAAGLTITRRDVTTPLLDTLLRERRVVVAGPSGSGKSAAVLMAAFETRHACRWIQVRRALPEDREDFRRFIAAQAPSHASPLILFVDDAGGAIGSLVWDLALEASLTIPSVHVVATAREENLAALPSLSQFKKIRPMLNSSFAELVWHKLKQDSATTWVSWQEPFELSRGLLLEYTHILTLGRGLQDVVEEEVNQRLLERRDAEFEVLRLTSAASSHGASVSVMLLAEHLGLSIADCARALQRLVHEHLVRRVGEDELTGLHPLRSRCILDSCLKLAPGSGHQLRQQALAIVTSTSTRTMIAGAVRLSQLDEQAVVARVKQRLRKTPEPELLIGALEGLKLCALDRDAEIFRSIASKHNIESRFFFLIMIVMSLGDEKYTGSKLETLAKVRDEFLASRTRDFRNDLLGELDEQLYLEIIDGIKSYEIAFGLLRSLSGLNLGGRVSELHSISSALSTASLEDTAAALIIAEELSPSLAQALVSALGGTSQLLERLWKETPWALKPYVTVDENGSNELLADLLAVDGELAKSPDSIVYEHAAQALAFAPHAKRVTSRPIQITGETLVIDGFSLGLKSFPRGNTSSRATIAWNRLLIHSVAQRNAASSTTEMMQRRKESLEIAARLFAAHADRRCRRRKLTDRHTYELKALDFLEDFFPGLPLEKPEIALNALDKVNLADSAGDLIRDIASACQRFYDSSIDGLLLADDMERIQKAVKSSRQEPRWSYVGGIPSDVLDHIESTARNMSRVFLALSKQSGLQPSLILMPSHQTWAKGMGVSKACQRSETQRERKVKELKAALAKQLSTVTITARPMSSRPVSNKISHWPDDDICILVECASNIEFWEWLEQHQKTLFQTKATLTSLAVVPLIRGYVIANWALQIIPGIGVLPSTDFVQHWSGKADWPLFVSPTVQAYDEALGHMLTFYATQEILADKPLLEAERTYLEGCRQKIEQAMNALREALSPWPAEQSEPLLRLFSDLNHIFANAGSAGERPAVELARVVFAGLGASKDVQPSEVLISIASIRTAFTEMDLSRLSPQAA